MNNEPSNRTAFGKLAPLISGALLSGLFCAGQLPVPVG
jgi:hypothetical protein